MSQLDSIKANDILIRELCEDPKYIIKNDGSIFSYSSRNGRSSIDPRKIGVHSAHDGYKRICYKRKVLMVHRIIFQKFVGELDPAKQINHKDGNRANNASENLELVDQSQNMKHAFRILKRPAVIGFSKISPAIAEQIRELAKQKTMTFEAIGLLYGIKKTAVSYIVNGKTWKAGAA